MNNEVTNDRSASTSVSVNEDAQLVPAPPFSLTLLAENPEFIEARLKFIKIMALRTVLMIMAIFAYFSIYWVRREYLSSRPVTLTSSPRVHCGRSLSALLKDGS